MCFFVPSIGGILGSPFSPLCVGRTSVTKFTLTGTSTSFDPVAVGTITETSTIVRSLTVAMTSGVLYYAKCPILKSVIYTCFFPSL